MDPKMGLKVAKRVEGSRLRRLLNPTSLRPGGAKELERIGSYDAKTHLAELLDRVEKGETVLITRHGRPSAMLAPASGGRTQTIDQVVSELLAFNKGRTLGIPFRDAIEEGRR